MNKLLRLLSQQPHHNTSHHKNIWFPIEEKYNIKIPDDYKIIIDELGSIYINEFIWILNPFNDNPTINFLASEYLLKTYNYMQEEFPERYTIMFNNFFPWAITDNGESICWLWDSKKTLKIGLFDKSQILEEVYDMSTSLFLLNYLTNNIDSMILNNRDSNITGENWTDLNAFLEEGINVDNLN
ncbi:MAG: hypothetical protein Q4G28_01905 [Neisseria sp.]|nr:hypothetical protein [Neisseria sp.]